MNTKTVCVSTLRTAIISALAITGIYCLPTTSKGNDSWSMNVNSFSFILAQTEGGFFKRLAAKNRAKKAQRQTYNAQRQQSSQPTQQPSSLSQWNPFPSQPHPQQTNQGNRFQYQGQSQTQQNSSTNLNQWNPFHNPNRGQTPQNSSTNLNQWNPFHNPNRGQTPQNSSTNLNQWNPFHNPNRGKTPQNSSTNLNQWNPFNNQPNENTQNTNNTGSRGLTGAERTSLVNYHNQVRSEVGVGPVRWSGEIAAHAQQWADEIARSGNFRHRQSNPYGENLAQGTAGYYTVVKLAEMWYGEKRYYTPGRPFSNSDMRAGHYTQMVWRGSTQMGAGKAIITSGRNKGNVVLVCNYAQRGNMIGQHPY